MHPDTEATASVSDASPDATPGEAPSVQTGEPVPDAPVASDGAPSPDVALEALLFACEEPLTPLRLAQILGIKRGEVLGAIDRLNVFYAESRRAFRIVALAGGFQLVTTPEHADILTKLHKDRGASKLSRAALETLAIIAFKQPVTRLEVDAIRGVSASDGVIRHLIERNLARIAGRAEVPGRPLLYGTTREFLAHFGLHALADLPRTDELVALLADDSRRLRDEEGEEGVGPETPGGTEGATGAPPRAAVVTGGSSSVDAPRPSWRDEHEADDDEDDGLALDERRSRSPGESDADDRIPPTQ